MNLTIKQKKVVILTALLIFIANIVFFVTRKEDIHFYSISKPLFQELEYTSSDILKENAFGEKHSMTCNNMQITINKDGNIQLEKDDWVEIITKGKYSASNNFEEGWIYEQANFVPDCREIIAKRKYLFTTGGGYVYEAWSFNLKTGEGNKIGDSYKISTGGQKIVVLIYDFNKNNEHEQGSNLYRYYSANKMDLIEIDYTKYWIWNPETSSGFLVPDLFVEDSGEIYFVNKTALGVSGQEVIKIFSDDTTLSLGKIMAYHPTELIDAGQFGIYYLGTSLSNKNNISLYSCGSDSNNEHCISLGEWLK